MDLQLPHLMKKTMLVEEIHKILGADMVFFNNNPEALSLLFVFSFQAMALTSFLIMVLNRKNLTLPILLLWNCF